MSWPTKPCLHPGAAEPRRGTWRRSVSPIAARLHLPPVRPSVGVDHATRAVNHSSPFRDTISGNLTILAAIRRASSCVSTLACRASFSSLRKYVWATDRWRPRCGTPAPIHGRTRVQGNGGWSLFPHSRHCRAVRVLHLNRRLNSARSIW
jgi:hypothetical protein